MFPHQCCGVLLEAERCIEIDDVWTAVQEQPCASVLLSMRLRELDESSTNSRSLKLRRNNEVINVEVGSASERCDSSESHSANDRVSDVVSTPQAISDRSLELDASLKLVVVEV
jgi:hypothetical protein